MTNDDGGVHPAAAPPPPVGYPGYGPGGYAAGPGGYGAGPVGYATGPVGYAAPGSGAIAPPGAPPPGYRPVPGYGSPGYPPYSGYPPYPGYRPVGPPPALKPGVIPLRPLGLSDIFNAAFAYVRVNPRATLGLTTIVAIITQLIMLLLVTGVPLGLYGQGDITRVENTSSANLVGSFLSVVAAGLTSGLSSVVLSGMLTVVVGRAVFGASITIREAWNRMRGRLLALLGLTLLEAVGAMVLLTVAVAAIALAAAFSAVLGVLVGVVLGVAVVAAFVYLWTMLSFAPVLIVLERLPVFAAIGRSFALVSGAFWRVFGIRALGVLVAQLVAAAVSAPFTIAAEILGLSGFSMSGSFISSALLAIGGVIGQIITAPFTAGIVVLLYTDRRIRAEAFDLVLQTGASPAGSDSPDSTDHLWLVRHL